MKPNVNVLVGGPIKGTTPCQYKTKILKANLPFKEQVEGESNENTKFVIKWDFDLKGETVTIPENCILEFDGGSLDNGKVVFSDTIVSSESVAFKDIEFEGTIGNDVDVKWFDIDTSGNTDYSDIIQQICNLGSTKILFPSGRYAFKGVQLNGSVDIIGQPGTIFVAQPRDEGINGFEYLFKSEVVGADYCIQNIEVTGDTTELEAVTDHINHPLFYFVDSNNVCLSHIFFNQVKCLHVEYTRAEGYPVYEFGLDVPLLMFFKRCKNVDVTDCEFYDCKDDEWILTYNESEERSVDYFVFSNNYIHNISPSAGSQLTINAKKMWVHNNKVEHGVYGGSLFNCHGENVIIENNVITDSFFTSVFDTSEYDSMYNDTVIVRNNIVECQNSIMLVSAPNICLVYNNRFKGICFAYIVGYLRNRTNDPYWNTHIYTQVPQHSFVDIVGNYADCNYYDVNKRLPPNNACFGICSVPSYVRGGKLNIKDNTIICNYDSGLLAGIEDKSLRVPILFSKYDIVAIENNCINGGVPLPNSGAYKYNIYLSITDGRQKSNVFDYNIKHLSIQNNFCNDSSNDVAVFGKELCIRFENGDIHRTENGNEVYFIPEIENFVYDGSLRITSEKGLSVKRLVSDSHMANSVAAYEYNSNVVYSGDNTGIPLLRKGRIVCIPGNGGGLFVASFDTCKPKYDSVEDLDSTIPVGAVVSFGSTVWQFLGGYNTIYDIPELTGSVVAPGTVVRIAYLGHLSFWRRCNNLGSSDRMFDLQKLAINGGGNSSVPNLSSGQNVYRGHLYFNSDIRRATFYDPVRGPIDEKGFSAAPSKGGTDNRPNGKNAVENAYLDSRYDIGFEYFDTDLGYPIYVNSIDDTTGDVTWAKSDGTILD